MREIVAVAGTASEENAIERLLDDAGVPYEITLDAGEGEGVCFLGRGYLVDASDAERVRRMLRDAGLQ